MLFDSRYIGQVALTDEDRKYQGSRFADVRKAIFDNAYYLSWRGKDEPPLPVYTVTLRRVLTGAFRRGARWMFRQASGRAIDSRADLRWGDDRRGFRRILHPNGVCLTGEWQILASPPGTAYTGYFGLGSRALVVARYSVCCTETRRGHYRSLSMVGKLYPTTDPEHTEALHTASFITQEDFGGSRTNDISEATLLNAPDTTPWRRGKGLPILLVTGLAFSLTDKQKTIRQMYEVAELGKPVNQPTSAPEFMRLVADPPEAPLKEPNLDFRDEILGRIYDAGNPTPQRSLTFHIEVSDHGFTKGRVVQRRVISDWTRIGRLVLKEAVASYNGDFVLHFPHPRWRNDRNDPSSAFRKS